MCQNLVQNGSFQVDLSSWDLYNGSAIRSEESFDGGTGSVALTNDDSLMGLEMFFQCVSITPLAEYQIDFSTMIQEQENTGNGQLVMYMYGTETCTGVPVGSKGLSGSSEKGAWHTTSTSLIAPASANSLILRLSVNKNDTTKPFTVLFDAITVQEIGAIPDYPKPECTNLRFLPHITSLTGGFSTQIILKNYGSVEG